MTDLKTKRRRAQRPRACDKCRRQKIGCDGLEGSDEPCSNCENTKAFCTYDAPAGYKNPKRQYIESLELRLQYMQRLLDKYIGKTEDDLAPPATAARPEAGEQLERCISKAIAEAGQPYASSQGSADSTSDESDDWDDELVDVSHLKANPQGASRLWHGKSSGVKFVKTAFEIKREVSSSHVHGYPIPLHRELADWEGEPNMGIPPQLPTFPQDDLIKSLLPLFFRYITPFMPIVHRATFEVQYADKLHLRDPPQAKLLLMMCTMASAYSDDPRVLHEYRGAKIPGYKYFCQVKDWPKLLRPATLADIQACVLESMYFIYIGEHSMSWVTAGVGIRLAQDVGAHRKAAPQSSRNPIEAEVWKRTFFSLVGLDRFVSAGLGYSPIVNDTDLDIDPPKELPLEDPFDVEYFRAFASLGSLVSLVMRSMYSVRSGPKTIFGNLSEAQLVVRFDSGLSKWMTTVPSHLRWDPKRADDIHFEQSADLHALFYLTMILTHRPSSTLINSINRQEEIPSLEQSTSAARSCASVIDAFARRSAWISGNVYYAAFSCAIVLMTNVWARRKGNPTVDVSELLYDIDICCCALLKVSHRWPGAIRFTQLLGDLAEFGGIPFPGRYTPESRQASSSTGMPFEHPRDMAEFAAGMSRDGQAPNNGDDNDSPTVGQAIPNLSHTVFDEAAFASEATIGNIWESWASPSELKDWGVYLGHNLNIGPQGQ